MITPDQLRAARGFLDMTRAEIAEATNLSPETIKNMEHGIYRPSAETERAIVEMLNARGIQLVSLTIGPFRIAVVCHATLSLADVA